MKFIFLVLVITFFTYSYSYSKVLNITVVCEKPDSIFSSGKKYPINEEEKKSFDQIIVQLNKVNNKARFKRLGVWSPWSFAVYTNNEVYWDIKDPKNNFVQSEGVFSKFEYWKFNLDLINRRLSESFVEKKDEDSDQTPQARGFSYPDCRKSEPMDLD